MLGSANGENSVIAAALKKRLDELDWKVNAVSSNLIAGSSKLRVDRPEGANSYPRAHSRGRYPVQR